MQGLGIRGELTSDAIFPSCSIDYKIGLMRPSSLSGKTRLENVRGTWTSPLIILNELLFLLFL